MAQAIPRCQRRTEHTLQPHPLPRLFRPLPPSHPQLPRPHLVKANVAAVQVVAAVVLRQRVVLALERKLPVLDAVADTAHNGAQVGRVLALPVGKRAKAKHNVGSRALAVGHAQRRDDLSGMGGCAGTSERSSTGASQQAEERRRSCFWPKDEGRKRRPWAKRGGDVRRMALR